jgi:hypothetical protein
MRNLEENWRKILSFVAPRVFRRNYSPPPAIRYPVLRETSQFDYANITPVPEITVINKQAAKRHHGVHGYFTRQVWSVVQRYIENFSRPGDVILDPFGGSGVTLVEALILQRSAIHIDINPLSKFIVETLISDLDVQKLTEDFGTVVQEFQQMRPHDDVSIDEILSGHPYPQGVTLPQDSDVRTVEELFDRKQLAELALLRSLILAVVDNRVGNTFYSCFRDCSIRLT